jgi:hypothetical protein
MIGFKQYLDESSLSRIWRMTQEYDSGAISGYRGDNPKALNRQNNREIVSFLRSKGYSVTAVDGSYIENKGTDTQREVKEPSFFVVDIKNSGNLERDLRALGQKYDQDSILIVPKGGKAAYLVGTSKRSNAWPAFGTKNVVGNSRFGKVAGEFLSRIRGREFAFEAYEKDWGQPKTINGIRGQSILGAEVEKSLQEIVDSLEPIV